MNPPRPRPLRLTVQRSEAASMLGMSVDSFERYVQADLYGRRLHGHPMRFWIVDLEHWVDCNATMPDGSGGKPLEPWPQIGRPYIPDRLRFAIYERDGHECVECGSPDRLSLDHVVPFSLGGPDTFENLRTLCVSCNSAKGARVPEALA